MSDQQAHVWITGRVQGVFFRAATRDQAIVFGLKGWVRNLRDGRVEAVLKGPSEQVKRMLDWCWQGPPHAYVGDVKIEWETVDPGFDDFSIRY